MSAIKNKSKVRYSNKYNQYKQVSDHCNRFIGADWFFKQVLYRGQAKKTGILEIAARVRQGSLMRESMPITPNEILANPNSRITI